MVCDLQMQTRLLCALAADPEFFEQNVNKLRLSDFPSATVRLLFETLRAHWRQYGSLPTDKVFPEEMLNAARGVGPDGQESITTSVPSTSVNILVAGIGSVVDSLKKPDTRDTAYFRDRLKEYLSTVRLSAMPGQDMNAVDQLEAAAQIKAEVDQITGGGKKGKSTSARKRVVMKRQMLPPKFGTGIWPIDIRMNRGLELGEIGCVLAGSGVGKSNILVNIAANAALRGQRSLFLTLELSEEVILRRLHAMMGNFPMSLMGTPEEEWPKADLARYDWMLSDAFPNIDFATINSEYVDKTPTCDDLDREIGDWRDSLERQGIGPEQAPFVLVDYVRQIDPGKLSTKNDNTNTKFGVIMQQLKRMAMKHRCVIWTAQQVTRAANRKEHIRKDDIADSIAIVNHCDAVLGFVPVGDQGNEAPTTEESEDDTVSNHADKERQMNVDFVKLRNAGETGSFCTVFQNRSLRLWTAEPYAQVADKLARSGDYERFFSVMTPKEAKVVQ